MMSLPGSSQALTDQRPHPLDNWLTTGDHTHLTGSFGDAPIRFEQDELSAGEVTGCQQRWKNEEARGRRVRGRGGVCGGRGGG